MTASTPFWHRVAALFQNTPGTKPHPAGTSTLPRDETAFTEALAERLRAVLPDEAIAIAAPLKLSFADGEATVNLGRVWQFCQANPEAGVGEVDAFVANAAQAFLIRNKPPERSQLRLVVQSAATAQAILARNPDMGLQIHPCVDGLVSVVMLDLPATMRWATLTDIEAFDLDAAAALGLARDNTRSALCPLSDVARPAPAGGMLALESDGSYTASRIQFVADWAPLATAQGGTLIVAVPAPTTVLYIGQDDAGTIASLRAWATELLQRAPEPLGAPLLRWTPDGWKPVP